MDRFQTQKITRQMIDDWPLARSGLSARVVHCLEEAGVKNIGQLRGWTDQRTPEPHQFRGDIARKRSLVLQLDPPPQGR